MFSLLSISSASSPPSMTSQWVTVPSNSRVSRIFSLLMFELYLHLSNTSTSTMLFLTSLNVVPKYVFIIFLSSLVVFFVFPFCNYSILHITEYVKRNITEYVTFLFCYKLATFPDFRAKKNPRIADKIGIFRQFLLIIIHVA